MKSQLELWSAALEELGSRCSVSTAADLETIRGRYAHEGDELFTIALPAFGKEFERTLALGYIPRDAYVGWAKRSKWQASLFTDFLKHSGIDAGKAPRFLGGFMDRVFDASNGALFDEYPGIYDPSDIDSVHAIRQLTLMFGKLKALPSQKRIDETLDGFIETDRQIAEHFEVLCDQGKIPLLTDELKKVLDHSFGPVLRRIDSVIYEGDLVPKHGPGATAEYVMGNQKYYQREWTDRMEQLFPYTEYAVLNHRYHYKRQDVVWLSPEQERPVRVIPVPKTAGKARIIAIEPVCMQYMQQAVSRLTCGTLESRFIPGQGRNPTSDIVGFTEQWPNQVMARIGSEDGSLATLDLSEASDRVPNWLVEALFEDYPWFSEAIQSTRSTRAHVRGRGVIPLFKFASMGSAMTFPVEAIVFATIALWAISLHQRGCSPSADNFGVVPDAKHRHKRMLQGLEDKVRVYGDDIIVPTDYAESVVEALEVFGFRVNRAKSFWTGKFRESCGKEYYNGADVSVVRFRQPTPSTQTRVTSEWTKQVLATASTRNQLYESGMWKTAALLDDVLESALKGFYPYVGENSPVIGRVSRVFGYEATHYDPDTQAPLVRGFVPRTVLPKNGFLTESVDPAMDPDLQGLDEEALLKCLLDTDHKEEWSDLLFPNAVDSEHLTRSGRPRAVGIKLVKASPF